MTDTPLHAATGAFGYFASHIACRSLAAGHRVIILPNSTDLANQFGGRVPAYPFHFDRPAELAASGPGTAAYGGNCAHRRQGRLPGGEVTGLPGSARRPG